MTTPVPTPSALPPPGNQLLTEGAVVRGEGGPGGRLTTAVVLSITRHGPLIEAGPNRWLISGAPPLPPGATLSLELGVAGRQEQSGRLLAIRPGSGAERVLEPPVTVRLQPTGPSAGTGASPAGDAPRPAAGVQLEARLLGPDGRPAGPPALVWLSAAGGAATDARAAAAEGAPPGQQGPGTPGQPPAQTGAVLAAEVVGRDASGRLLLRAAGLTLRLEAVLDLPAGARLHLILPPGLATSSLPALDDDPLRRVIEALLHRPAGPTDGREAGALRLPAVDHALAAQLLRWVQALRASASGPQAELDDGLEPRIEAGPLRSALGELARHAREPQAGGWRVLLMPLGAAEPQPLRLYLRDVPPDPERDRQSGREERPASRRAIFEVELSRLGRCQLDVLCRAARFDLVVRTEEPLPAALQGDIRVLVHAASEVGGVTGKVEFRAAGLLAQPAPHPATGRQITA
jgi:hypothetical protein